MWVIDTLNILSVDGGHQPETIYSSQQGVFQVALSVENNQPAGQLYVQVPFATHGLFDGKAAVDCHGSWNGRVGMVMTW